MAYVVFNLTHIIPRACKRSNFGIILSEDRRTLSPGRHRILQAVSPATMNLSKKRVIHNGVEYEMLRIIKVKSDTVMSPEDRKKLAEILDKTQTEIDEKFGEKVQAEKDAKIKREEILIQNRIEDRKVAEKVEDEGARLDIFKKGERYDDFENKDGIVSGAKDHLKKVEEQPEPTPEPEPIPEPEPVKEEPKPEPVVEKVPEGEPTKEVMDEVAKKTVNEDIPQGFLFDNDSGTEEEEPAPVVKKKKAKKKRSRRKKVTKKAN